VLPISVEQLIEVARELPDSTQRFPDGGQYRVEIPSVEGAGTAELVLDTAAELGVPVHRISQGSGISLLTDAELGRYAKLGAERRVEVCLFVGPRAPWDGAAASALTPDGGNVGWRHAGLRSLLAARDDVRRAADLGIRSVLPAGLVVKASALLGIANPVGAAVLAGLGVDSLNIAADTPFGDLAAYRAATPAFLDLYIEAPDGLGGFIRYHDLGEIVRLAAPVYLKFGLRNAPGIYPAGEHLRGAIRGSAVERVRRGQVGMEHLRRQYPGAVMSPHGADARGIPEP
jgi:hypothetical protein